jgi:peroxiredoxin
MRWAAGQLAMLAIATLTSIVLPFARGMADDHRAAAPLATVPRFSLTDADGVTHSNLQWRDAKAVVLLFLGAECPVSNGYSPVFRDLARRYAARGVMTLGVYSDPTLTADAAAAHAKEYDLDFPTLFDPEQVLARGCGARITPEAVVALATGEVVYRGRIDNRYALDGKRRDEANVFDLDAALTATLAGKLPAVRETKAFGCPLPSIKAK